MSITVMKQALEALELEDMACRYEKEPTPEHIAKSITALRQAIEQAEKQDVPETNFGNMEKPVQEPVAWESILGAVARGWCYEENANKTMDSDLAVAIAKEVQALYTTPQPKREWVDLSDELIDKTSWDFAEYEGFQQGARWAQAKLKEKNT